MIRKQSILIAVLRVLTVVLCLAAHANNPALAAATPVTVSEFYNSSLLHYFRTADAAEAAGIEQGKAGPGWTRTGKDFLAWLSSETGSTPVCRFYGTPGRGPNSHFYTADPAECAGVKLDPGWTYEGIGFYAVALNAGSCPAGDQPVYRSYNNRAAQNDSNHRFTTDLLTQRQMRLQSWADEGAVMCVPLAANATMRWANLFGAQETPAIASAASGQGSVVFDSATRSLGGGVFTRGIEGTMAHIHEGAIGANGGIVVTLAAQGNGLWSIPAGTVLNAAQANSLLTGNLYFNVHSASYSGGEIRGQIALSTPPASGRLLPDAGIRVNNASNPFVAINAAGTVYLAYEDQTTHLSTLASATDALGFGAGSAIQVSTHPNDPHRVLMPDGVTWRLYQYDLAQQAMLSRSSSDGVNFTLDSGVRYKPTAGDANTLGVYDVYAVADGSVVMLYLGDMQGKNNLRMARSRDNGMTFVFEKGNVLGDDNAGGGANSYVDPKSLLLADGRRRLYVMKSLSIYSFISSDGSNYVPEPGVRLATGDWTEFAIYTLNDPAPVRLPDGRTRIYVAASRTPSASVAPGTPLQWVIVSATLPE